ncbi:MAG: ribulose-phosphate 3-epimerase [Bacillales bacterium]|nr:ribulose-phosphate 3-epimerase [Bacillales bacterium]
MSKVKIGTSILGTKDMEIINIINELILSGVDYIHYDVMDGIFVENKSFSVEHYKSLKNYFPNIMFDVHLMVADVKKWVEDFISAGATMISFHYEAFNKNELSSYIDDLHKYNIKVGIAINPDTSVTVLNELLNKLDFILVMSVVAGRGGQKFNDVALDKIEYLNDYRKAHNLNYLIQVDGGINDETIIPCKEKGVDLVVSGSFILKRKPYIEQIKLLK